MSNESKRPCRTIVPGIVPEWLWFLLPFFWSEGSQA